MKPIPMQRVVPRRVRRHARAISEGCFAQFFNEDMSPQDFLNRLHNVMADYVMCAGGQMGYADLATVADNVAFLQMVYELVDRAAFTDDEPTETDEPWDEPGKKG